MGELKKLDSNLEAIIDKYITQFLSKPDECLQSSEITNSQLETSYSCLDDKHLEQENENVSCLQEVEQHSVPLIEVTSIYQDLTDRDNSMINNIKLDESLINRLPYSMYQLMDMFDCPLSIGCENTLIELENDFLQITPGDRDDTHTSISDTIPEHTTNEQCSKDLEHDEQKLIEDAPKPNVDLL